jgi:Carboxypeptidase regulatory-like domain
MVGLALAALLCALAALLPLAADAATGSISGTVTDASTAEPIQGVQVCAESFNEEEGGYACGLTETDGTYFIGGLEPGQYRVSFWSGGKYVFQYFEGASAWSEADPVEVVSGSTTPGIDAEMELTAGIEGTVIATEDGLGVEEVEVCAYPLAAGEESFWECSETGSDGSYEIDGLNPGSYKVEFWPGWTGRNLAYQFYDHRNRYAEADVVSLGEGERKAGIDADLQPGALISGNVSSAATGRGLEEIRVCSIDAATDKLTTCTWTSEVGSYRLRFLSAGPYKIVFSPELFEWFPGEAFPGEEDDGYPTQFWNHQTTLAAANVLSLGTGGSAPGIDAQLGTPPPPPPVLTPAPRRHKHCRRGFHKKRVHGKVRCVRKRHRHRRHPHAGAGAKRLVPPTTRLFRR